MSTNLLKKDYSYKQLSSLCLILQLNTDLIIPVSHASAWISLYSLSFCVASTIQVAGAAILGVGVWVKVDSASLLGIVEHVEDEAPGLSQLANVGYLLIAVGGVLLVIGFLGCCGAIRESRCMLLTVSKVWQVNFCWRTDNTK